MALITELSTDEVMSPEGVIGVVDDLPSRDLTHAASSSVGATTSGRVRIASLDFVKGILVLVMILYHWLNYYIGLQWGGYRYLRFLTPSFIFLTGYLVSAVYLQRYSFDDPQLRRRLITRGLKLLALFIALNVVTDLALGARLHLSASGPSELLDTAIGIFVTGNGRAAFDILVSISYFLLVAPVILLASRRSVSSLFAVASVSVLVVEWLSVTGQSNPHLEMLSIALVGLAAGARPFSGLNERRASTVVICAYALYLVAISKWNVLYPLQVIGVCLTLLLLRAIAIVCGSDGFVQRHIIRIGQYSLLGYIAQIGAFQILWRVTHGRSLVGSAAAAPLIAAMVVTVVTVELAAIGRQRLRIVDRLYRMMFA